MFAADGILAAILGRNIDVQRNKIAKNTCIRENQGGG
jgi:hypothetical protein